MDMTTKESPRSRDEGIELQQNTADLKTAGIFLCNYGNPDAADPREMERECADSSRMTISTWGFMKQVIVPEYRTLERSEGAVPLIAESIVDRYLSGGDLDWETIRDDLADEVYGGNKNKAGQARGSLSKFIDGMQEGSRILGAGPSGTRFGVVQDDVAYYHPEASITDIEPYHKLFRPVEWARDETGDPITVESDQLPPALQRTRLTVTSVDDEDIEKLAPMFAGFEFHNP